MTVMAAFWSRAWRPALAVAAGALCAAPALAADDVLRCGWYENPTPGNHFLTDADGIWVLGLQGAGAAPGFDMLPPEAFEFSGNWVEVNGYYGYGCACLRGQFGPVGSEEVLSVSGMNPLALSRCTADPALPAPGG